MRPGIHRPIPVPRPTLRVVAAACALGIWLLGLFGASAQLHSAVHHEAGDHGHVCAITLFRDGVENPLPVVAIVVAPEAIPAGTAVSVLFVPKAAAEPGLPPSCGPPLC